MKRIGYCPVALLVGSVVCFGDAILLKNGTSIDGVLVNMDAGEVALKRCGRVEYFAKDDIKAIQVQPVAGSEVCTGTPSKVELPAGFSIRARMTEYVDSFREPRGQVFLATLEQPVVVDGRTLVPRGVRLLVELIEVGTGPLRSLNLIAIELRKSSWIRLETRLDGKISPEPLTAAKPVTEAKMDSKDLQAERILVPAGTELTFVLKRAITMEH
jgi:hypothetical protein